MTQDKQNSETTKIQTKRPRKLRIEDRFIREVRVQYQHSPTEMFKIEGPEDSARFLRGITFDNSREHLFALYLDGGHKVAFYSLVSLGGAVSCPVHPREIFQRAVLCGAAAIIIAHNHPSGALQPSEADWSISVQLQAAGQLLSIPVLDHIIFSDAGEYSMGGSTRWLNGLQAKSVRLQLGGD